MELNKRTKRNIAKITGRSVSDLLIQEPVEDFRLRKLQRHRLLENVDTLIRGNPQLTMGYVTPPKVVDEYFKKRQERRV